MEESSLASEAGTNRTKKAQDKLKNRFVEKDANVTLSTYSNFFISTPINYFMVPFTLLLFIMSEGAIAVYYRFLADFDNVKAGTSSSFGSNFKLYWGIMAMILILFLVILVIKYYCLNYTLLKAN